MDATDLRILRLMGVQPFSDWPRHVDHLKPAYFARELNLSPETAKSRVRRMEKDGIISHYEIYPNWTQLGLYVAAYLFRCGDAAKKAEALGSLAMVEGVAEVENFLGSDLGLEIVYRTQGELDRRIRLVSKLLGGAEPVSYVPFASLPVKAPLSRLDWRIVRALRHRAARPLAEVAKELKVSARTVRRRFDRMWEEGSIDTVVRLNIGRVANHIFCNFLVRFHADQDPKAARSLFRAAESEWAYCWSPPDRSIANLVVGMVFRSPAEVDAMTRRLLAVPHVKSAEALVSVSYTSNAEAWLDEAIDERIRSASQELEGPVASVR